MRLSSLADYAIVMMTAAARTCDTARLNATVLAGVTGVPLPTAQKLVSRLAAAGLIESARGTGGGVSLAREADRITLADIIEAVEGPIALTTCVDEERQDCALDGHCQVKPHWAVVNRAVREALANVTLAHLSSVRAEPVEAPSFHSPSAEQQGGALRLPACGSRSGESSTTPDPIRGRTAVGA